MSHHKNGPDCPSCLDKLSLCHPDMAILHAFISKNHVDAHISWGFRDKECQNEAVKCGKSFLHWPDSAHNKTDGNGNPCSEALDYFRQDAEGNGHWEKSYFKVIYDELYGKGFNVRWGGKFPHLGDFDHFERISAII